LKVLCFRFIDVLIHRYHINICAKRNLLINKSNYYFGLMLFGGIDYPGGELTTRRTVWLQNQ
jgi:hypothetical protein